MVSQEVVVSFCVALLMTTLAPVALLIVLGARRKLTAAPLFLGAAAFFVSQMLLRMPILSALSTQKWFQGFAANTIPYVLVLSLSAGLFEESARLGGALLLKRHRTFRDAVSFGLGHGICEVILLAGMTHLNNVLFCLVINSGSAQALAGVLPAGTLEQVTAQLMAVTPAAVYWGILERVSAVLFHLFATVLVFEGVVRRKAGYYLLAVGAHTLFNVAGVLLAGWLPIWGAELILLLLALAGGWYVLLQRDQFPKGMAEC